MSDAITIQSLHIYPIKSCGAIDVQEAFVSARGLVAGKVADRRFMLIRPDGSFITQRERPELARAKLSLLPNDGGSSGLAMVSRRDSDTAFVLDPGNVSGEAVTVGMHTHFIVPPEGKKRREREMATAHVMKGPGSEWFSALLGEEVRLVYQTDDDLRYGAKDFTPRPGEDIVSLADGYQMLLTSYQSLRDVIKGIGVEKPMNRFRPNLTVDGDLAPNDENAWAEARLGGVSMAGVKPCTRCQITAVDQETGIADEPALIAPWLGANRRVSYVQGETPVIGGIFGENMVPLGEGPVRVGDKVTVVRRKPSPEFLPQAA